MDTYENEKGNKGKYRMIERMGQNFTFSTGHCIRYIDATDA